MAAGGVRPVGLKVRLVAAMARVRDQKPNYYSARKRNSIEIAAIIDI